MGNPSLWNALRFDLPLILLGLRWGKKSVGKTMGSVADSDL